MDETRARLSFWKVIFPAGLIFGVDSGVLYIYSKRKNIVNSARKG